MSLKNALEDSLSDAIAEVLLYSSPSVDPDLAVDERLLSVSGGTMPYDQDLSRGPLARVMVPAMTPNTEEFGTPDQRVVTLDFTIQVTGTTGVYTSQGAANRAASNIEEILRLRLANLAFSIETNYSDEKLSYAGILSWQGSAFDSITMSGRQTAPVIGSPAPQAGHSGNVSLLVDPAHAYMGVADEQYQVEVVAPNVTAGKVAGLTYRYKEGSGAWSSAISASAGFNPLTKDIYVQFVPTGIASPGDAWTIDAKVSQLRFVAAFAQTWNMLAESVAVY
jgi:hypothetical protein